MPAGVWGFTHALRLLQVWSVLDQQWCCKIDEGPAGKPHQGCMRCGRLALPLETSPAGHDAGALPALKASSGVRCVCSARRCAACSLVTSEFQIRITIWSLVNKSSLHVTGPKHAHRGMAFSPDQSLMAVLEVSSGDIAGSINGSRLLALGTRPLRGGDDITESTTRLSRKAHSLPPTGQASSLPKHNLL